MVVIHFSQLVYKGITFLPEKCIINDIDSIVYDMKRPWSFCFGLLKVHWTVSSGANCQQNKYLSRSLSSKQSINSLKNRSTKNDLWIFGNWHLSILLIIDLWLWKKIHIDMFKKTFWSEKVTIYLSYLSEVSVKKVNRSNSTS